MTDRLLELTSPLGDDLHIRGMGASEQLGRLYYIELELLSLREDIAKNEVLGKTMAVKLEIEGHDDGRYFHGYVNRFSLAGVDGDYKIYHATLVPWLWFLTRSANCRIYAGMKVPDIIKQVFRDSGFSEFEDRLSGAFRTWEYCVQYRETDFNFVSRLMEQEGIYYYFKHEQGRHKMVLANNVGGHDRNTAFQCGTVPFYPPNNTARRDEDHLNSWLLNWQIQPGGYVLSDYNFKDPSSVTQVARISPESHDHDNGEYFDFPGEYKDGVPGSGGDTYVSQDGKGDDYVRARLEELAVEHEQIQTSGNVRGLSTGCLFELTGHPRNDQNVEYLVVSTVHDARINDLASGEAGDTTFNVSLTAVPSARAYRSPRTTRKPVMQGPQTALVMEEPGGIDNTDMHGCVRIEFPWDRARSNQCWVRVAQFWAGNQWGAQFIPRIGQEVVVEFLDGDPDRPIITGSLYNNENKPTYTLPGDKTKSGIRSVSYDTSVQNEICFQDKGGEEEIRILAGRDLHVEVGFDGSARPSEYICTNKVNGGRNYNILGNDALVVEGGDGRAVQVNGGFHSLKIDGGDQLIDVSAKIETKAGSTIETKAGTSIELKVGGSSIKIEAAGITITAPKVTIDASIMATINGGLVKIN
jgi:type VI secretion system secreted protein VgrG